MFQTSFRVSRQIRWSAISSHFLSQAAVWYFTMDVTTFISHSHRISVVVRVSRSADAYYTSDRWNSNVLGAIETYIKWALNKWKKSHTSVVSCELPNRQLGQLYDSFPYKQLDAFPCVLSNLYSYLRADRPSRADWFIKAGTLWFSPLSSSFQLRVSILASCKGQQAWRHHLCYGCLLFTTSVTAIFYSANNLTNFEINPSEWIQFCN